MPRVNQDSRLTAAQASGRSALAKGLSMRLEVRLWMLRSLPSPCVCGALHEWLTAQAVQGSQFLMAQDAIWRACPSPSKAHAEVLQKIPVRQTRAAADIQWTCTCPNAVESLSCRRTGLGESSQQQAACSHIWQAWKIADLQLSQSQGVMCAASPMRSSLVKAWEPPELLYQL